MQTSYVNNTALNCLEDYAVLMASALLSLQTLYNMQARAIEIGIMPEDLNERSNTIIWDLKRMINLHVQQLGAALELIPDDFDHDSIIKKLQQDELKKARSMIRKKKEKCDI